jgi:S-adenosylmethionine synthetase
MSLTVSTAESATSGHPDKIADQLSDTILDAVITGDKYARVSCEAMVTTGLVAVMGEITTRKPVDYTAVVRETLRRIGYTTADLSFHHKSCAVVAIFEPQSPELAIAVDRKGAGDQGMMVGYATDEGRDLPVATELMPVPILLAHRLARRLDDVRSNGALPYLYPDGKTQVTVEFEGERPVRLRHVVISAHHQEGIDIEELRRDLSEQVIETVLGPTGLLVKGETVLHLNPTGSFTRGGPIADVGLTGRKIVSDSYGLAARHGGSGLSGKDPTKTDRSAAYAARWAAKNIVAAGLARRCEIQLSYVLGESDPASVQLDAFDTATVPVEQLERAVNEVFDFSPAAVIEELDLRRPIYAATAVYGHYGRTEPEFTWERLNRVDALRAACGVEEGAVGR